MDRAAVRRERARREEAERLDADILAAIGGGWDRAIDPQTFDRLAREVFAHQFRFNPVYRQFCHLRGVDAPADVTSWHAIPPTPTGAFKVGRWATFPEEREVVVFETSGTTSDTPGAHRFESLALYNAAIVSGARRYLVPDVDTIRCLFLCPAPAAVPRSSLVHMFAVYREAFGAPESEFFVSARVGAGLRLEAFQAAVENAVDREQPVLIAGAALAFHHALDAIGPDGPDLPPGSRTLITGGFKGAVRQATPASIAAAIETRLGVPASHQVEEYGMTELSSQYYTAGLRNAVVGGREESGFRVPPWARVVAVEPETGRSMAPGEEGLLVHIDLANRASAVAIQTSDVGVRTATNGVRLTGRAPDAEARGCSLAAELWLDRV